QDPIRPLTDVGPTADRRDPTLQRVDLAFASAQFGYSRSHIVCSEVAVAQILPEPSYKARGSFRALLAEVGKLALLPEAAHLVWRLDAVRYRRLLAKSPQYSKVDGFRRGRELGSVGLRFKIAQQRAQAAEPRLCLAPEQLRQRRKAMLLDCVYFVIGEVQRIVVACRQSAERPILLVPAGASGDLCRCRSGQPALPLDGELGERSKADMRGVEVHTQADRIGGVDVVDFAGLEQLDLAVTGFRAQAAHHDRGAAAE